MNTFRSQRFALLLVVLLPAWGAIERAQAAPPSDDTPPSAAAPAEDSPTRDAPLDLDSGERAGGARPGRRHRHGNSVVSMGHDSILRGDEHADSVVSIFGSSTSAGEAGDVVSILGDTRVSGPVKDSAVAVLGDTYVDSPVDGSVVAVLGNVELGPHADIGGDVVAVGGKVTRDAASIIHGNVNSIAGGAAGAAWLRPWIDHCLLYARPLALVPGIGWAWGLACALWALYLGLALLFREAITECVNTLETQPGTTALAALLTLLLIPVLLVLLCITVIGLVAVPFLGFALFCAGLFGKAVMLAWLGRRCLGGNREGALGHPALAVLIGGALVLALYCVPVLGIVVYKLLGLLGLGAVAYTLALAVQARRASQGDPARSAAPRAAAAAAETSAAAETTAGGAATAAAAPDITAALPRAGFWIRMLALLLDALLVGFLMGVLHHVFKLELLVLAAYGAVMWKLRGSTIGGIVFDLRVVRLDGRPIDWETAIVRALGCFLSLAVAGLGFFWIAF
ncbi:MAG TPA: RDD family protein, partial [Steroidobacteraceae bacterium]|nr:RDD family protein [Steroidobacteraceae bacterium]